MGNKTILVRLGAFFCLFALTLSMLACNQRLDGSASKLPEGSLDIDDVVGNIDTSINSGDKDHTYEENGSVKIIFASNGASVLGAGATASGNDVTITGNGTFILSGECSDGSITVNSQSTSKIQLVLNGLKLSNSNGPVINIRSAKKVTLTLPKDTDNVLSDGKSYDSSYVDSSVDATIFSKSNLVFNGEGKLTVNGNYAHAVVSKDNLTLTSGVYSINSKKTGLYGKDCIKLSGCDVNINAGTDALKSDNDVDTAKGFIYIADGTYTLKSVNDAIQAINVATIDGGSFDITTTATSSTLSAKAIKGGSAVAISGGTFMINSQDDAIHSNGSVVIAGGDFTVYSGDDAIHADDTLDIANGNIAVKKCYEGIEATNIYISGGYVEINSTDDGMNASGGNDSNASVPGRPGGDMFGGGTGTINISGGYIIIHNEGDGVDSNGTLEISGGIVLVDGPSRGGNGSLDYDSSAKITGGIVITLGTRDMAQNFSEATQGSMLVSTNTSFTAGTTLALCDEKGNVVLAFTSTKTFTCALFSAPELELGKTYTFYVGADIAGLDENGFAHNTTKTGGESCGSVTLSSLISGQGSGMPGGGGFPGGRPR